MEVICQPYLQYRMGNFNETTLVINSILYERLIGSASIGYSFYKIYPKLAEDCMSVIIEGENVCDFLDQQLNIGFEQACLRNYNDVDLWAANYAVGGLIEKAIISDIIGQQNPVAVFEEVRRFYEEHPVRTFAYPYSAEEGGELLTLLDRQAGGSILTQYERECWGIGNYRGSNVGGSAVGDIAWSLLLFPHGFAYVPSHSFTTAPEYATTLSRIDEELRKNANLRDVFKAAVAEESIKYLLGERVGQLNELLGFTPLNPLELVARKGVPSDQFQKAILKIRKDCGKIRGLFEKVHVNCLSQKIDEAAEAKRNLADMDPNRSINYSILEHTGEFLSRPFEDAVHFFIDKMLEGEMNSRFVELSRHLKKFRQNRLVGLVSEAKFLTFAAMLILASSKLPTPGSVSDLLGQIGLITGGAGVASKLFEKGMKVHPGFNLYASFVDWPQII